MGRRKATLCSAARVRRRRLGTSQPLLGKSALWFDSCKRPPPISDHSVFAILGGRLLEVRLYNYFIKGLGRLINGGGRGAYNQGRKGALEISYNIAVLVKIYFATTCFN